MADTPQYLQENANSAGTVAMNAKVAASGFEIAPTVDPLVAEREKEASTPSASEVALSMYRRDTIIGNLFSDYRVNVKDGDILGMDDSFNPYSYFAKNREEWKDVEQYVRQGGFDHIYNEDQFKALASQVRREQKDLKTVESASGAGLALGMGLSLLDLATLIPMAAPAKGMSAAYNAGRVGISAVAQQGAQEAFLHGRELTRTGHESALNMAMAGVIGGGIGIWGSAAHPSMKTKIAKALDENEEHPVMAMAPGQNPADADHVGSLGAARYTAEDTKLAGGGTRVGNWLRAATPVGRAFQWTSGAARETMQGMLELGGSLTRGMSAGHSGGFAAEDLAREYMTGFERAIDSLDSHHHELNVELGATNSKVWQSIQSDVNAATGGLYTGLPIDKQLYGQIVSRKLTNRVWQETGAFKGIAGDTDIDAQWMRQTLKEYGFTDEAFDTVDKWTSKTAKEIQQGQLELEDLMVKKGMLPEEKRLGKGYGIAQLWNSEAIIEKTDEARSFFMSVFAKKPSEEFLADNFGMTLADFEKLPMTDIKRGQIMTEWVGEAEHTALEQAKANYEALLTKADETAKAAETEAYVLGVLKTEHKKANLKAIRAKTREHEASLHLQRIEKYQEIANDASARLDEINAKIEHHTGIAEGAAADRGPLGELLDNLGPAVADAKSTTASAKGSLGANARLSKGATEAELATLTKQREAITAELVQYRAELEKALTEFKETAKEMGMAQRWIDASVKSVEALQTKVTYAEGKQVIDKLSDSITNRYQKLRGITEEAIKARAEMWQARRAMQSSASAASRLAEKTATKAGKAGKTVDRLTQRMPMADYVDKLVDRLTSHEKIPLSQLKEYVGDSGRLKDRMINLSTEERRAAEEAGFLHHDLPYVLERQYKDLSGRMALMDKFGEMLEEGGPTIKRIKEDYQTLIRNAADAKKRAELQDELKSALKDVIGIRDRILGRNLMNDDQESLVTWGVGKLRQLTFLRFVGGFAFGSLGDIAANILHGGLGTRSFGMAKKAWSLLQESGLDPASRELKSMVQALEMTMAHSTAGKLYGVDDLFNKQGVGTGLTRKITGKIDQVTNFIASRANTYAGMTMWNGMGKAVAGLTQMANLAEELPRWASLSSSRKAQLASLGIGESEAKTLAKFMEKHGEWHDGLFDPNAFKWHGDAGGIEAHRMLRIVTRKLMDRGVTTPGIGDVPLVMNSTLGKLIFQFQSMGFAYTNRFMTPAAQRLFLHGDMKAVGAFGALFGLAALSETIKAYIRGEDITKLEPEKFTSSVIDRSGVMAYTSTYLNAGMKLAGMGGSSRYQANTAWETLLGPWAGTLKTGAGLASDASQGEWEKAAKKAHLLMPFNQFSRLASHIYDDTSQ